jgi:hypothetical protein
MSVFIQISVLYYSDYSTAKATVHLFNDKNSWQWAIPDDSWFSHLTLTFNKRVGVLDVKISVFDIKLIINSSSRIYPSIVSARPHTLQGNLSNATVIHAENGSI